MHASLPFLSTTTCNLFLSSDNGRASSFFTPLWGLGWIFIDSILIFTPPAYLGKHEHEREYLMTCMMMMTMMIIIIIMLCWLLLTNSVKTGTG